MPRDGGGANPIRERRSLDPALAAGIGSGLALKGAKPGRDRVLKTEPNNPSLALDPRTGRVYLPVAALAPPAKPGARATPVPGAFQVLVVGS